MELQKELANTEDRIQWARRFYNANVRDLNTRIEVAPSNIVADWFKVSKRELFAIEDTTSRTGHAGSIGGQGPGASVGCEEPLPTPQNP